jgi:hypothetical protein
MFVSAVGVLVLCAATSAGATTVTVSEPSLRAALTFTDPAGDSNGAPDITTVAISDEFESGTITLAVTAPGGPQTSDSVLNVWFDVDKSPTTGDENGNEYITAVDMVGHWGFWRWNGSDWESALSPTVHLGKDGETQIWSFNKADLGGTTGVAIYVVGAIWGGGRDRAPDAGAWTYDLATEPPAPDLGTPMIGNPSTTPLNPMAGRRFAVSFWVTWSETTEAVTSGAMICNPTIAGRTLRHVESFKNGQARASLTIPRSAKGKLLKVKLTITSGGRSATRVSKFRIR